MHVVKVCNSMHLQITNLCFQIPTSMHLNAFDSHYTKTQQLCAGLAMGKRLLTVGDGDLSFSLALSRAFNVDIIASTWLSEEDLLERYKSAAETRDELLQRGVVVLHEVDACHLEKLKDLSPVDVAIFNFPHLGDVGADFHRPESEHVQRHVMLLSHFLHSATRWWFQFVVEFLPLPTWGFMI